MNMQVPEEMKYVAGCFHQDIFLFESTLEGIVKHALQFTSQDQRAVAKKFLLTLLDRAGTPAQVRQVWTDVQFGIRIDDDQGMLEFLSYLRDQL